METSGVATATQDTRLFIEWLGSYVYARAIHMQRYHAQGSCTTARDGRCPFEVDHGEEIRMALEHGGEQ